MSDGPKPFTPGKIDVATGGLPTWGTDPRWATITGRAIMLVAGDAVFSGSRTANGRRCQMRRLPRRPPCQQ